MGKLIQLAGKDVDLKPLLLAAFSPVNESYN